MIKHSCGSVSKRKTRSKEYLPDMVPRSTSRSRHGDVRIICPKTGQVLEVIKSGDIVLQESKFNEFTRTNFVVTKTEKEDDTNEVDIELNDLVSNIGKGLLVETL